MTDANTYLFLHQLAQKSNKLIFCFDAATGSFLYLNSSFETTWSLTSQQIQARPGQLLDSVHPEDLDFLEREFERLLSGETIDEVDFRILLPNQIEKCLHLSAVLLPGDGQQQLVAGIAEDVTSQRDNIRNLQKFAAKKNSILEILAHDLAGPLASIQSLSGSLSESFKGKAKEEDAHMAQLIYKTSVRSIQMIRDFVKQEFLESSNAGMMKVRLNLAEKIQEVVEQYQEGERNIKKYFSYSCASPQVYISLDQNKFMQVINNLISNSIKFSKDDAHIDITLSEQEDRVLVEVKDDGIGIPEEYHEELFDKFTRARRNGLKGEPSVGLGMSLIKTIVEWHGGRIWFTSQENAGTTFFIELPKE
ncbi:PAS domain-containing protein [Nibribacter ruber]|uniref:histidine kinase n=1 Tax=Nibribacter ruber TaxID=2698458 RepID=A0A6P1NS69_9BACT|nr:sensor histidine kinase [Nibribacter ruber]QHL86676.1 PAS domain-containing protein [Nibribacter ruber]